LRHVPCLLRRAPTAVCNHDIFDLCDRDFKAYSTILHLACKLMVMPTSHQPSCWSLHPEPSIQDRWSSPSPTWTLTASTCFQQPLLEPQVVPLTFNPSECLLLSWKSCIPLET
jgi:hypothetical protein